MSEHLNVGDVTGPRWAGGTRNPETMPDEVDATPDEAFDLGTVAGYDEGFASRNAEVAALREQLAAAEAVIEKVNSAESEWRRTPMGANLKRDWARADIHFRTQVLAILRAHRAAHPEYHSEGPADV